jgi:hypothetical protein
MSKFRLKPGVNHCTNAEYHGDKNYLSSSNLKLILKDPEKFKKEIIDGLREEKQVNAFDEGNYAHSLILEPESVSDEYAFFPKFRKAGKEWESFKEENKDKIILSKPQKHRVEQWVDAYRKRPEAVQLISGGYPEHSIAGELMGINVKVRADYINVDKGYIADVKTTGYSPDVDSFSYVVKSLMYDLSAALYCQMFSQIYNKPFDFYYIVLGKKDVACEVYKASKETIERGDLLVMDAIKKYKYCKENNIWTNQRKDVIVEDSSYEILEV